MVLVPARSLGTAQRRAEELKVINDRLRVENRRLWLENAKLSAKIKELTGIPEGVTSELKAALEEICAAHGWDTTRFRTSKNVKGHTGTRRQIIAAMRQRFDHLSISTMARFLGIARKTLHDATSYGDRYDRPETSGELF